METAEMTNSFQRPLPLSDIISKRIFCKRATPSSNDISDLYMYTLSTHQY